MSNGFFRWIFLAGVTSFFFFGCDGDTPADAERDAGTRVDASPDEVDSGSDVDAGSEVADAGLTPDDGGGEVPDSGETEDSGGLTDDGGTMTDAGSACPVGMAGPDCTECATGYQDANNDGTCALGCDATGADALDCGSHGTCAVDASSGTRGCTCEAGYAGELCDACAAGYEMTPGGCALNLPPTTRLSFWLDADYGASITRSGTAVLIWQDRGVTAAQDATQATASRRPGYVPNARNGRAAVRFDGVDDELLSANYFGLSVDDYEIIVACNPLDAGTPNGILGATGTPDTAWGVLLDQNPSNDFRLTHRSPAAATGGLFVTADRTSALGPSWVAASHSSASANDSLVIYASDGSAIEETTTNIPASMGFPAALTLHIGRSGTGYMLGDIYEVLIYTRRLSDVERQEVIDYLRAKWSL